MNLNSRLTQKLKVVLFAALAIAGLPAISKAQFLIYSDTFQGGTSGTPINNQVVQTSTGFYGGTKNATWTASGVSYTSSNGASLAIGSDAAFLPLAPVTNYTYTVSAVLFPGGGNTFSLGFGSGTTVASLDAYVTLSGGTLTLFDTTTSTQVTGLTGIQQLTLSLTDNGGSNWTETVTNQTGSNPAPLASLTFSGNPTVTDVGFGSSGGSSAVNLENFSLNAVPEPSSYISGLIVLGFLAFEIRRRAVAPKLISTS